MPRAFTWYVLLTKSSTCSPTVFVMFSAQIVIDMIMCDRAQKVWKIPEWLPERYLTENRFRRECSER